MLVDEKCKGKSLSTLDGTVISFIGGSGMISRVVKTKNVLIRFG
jgi:ABC-type histidine transport system ATPase subunit